MTVEATRIKEIYLGNGAGTVFPVPFGYGKTADIKLMFTDAAGKESPVTSNFEIQATANGDTSVVYPVAGQPIPLGSRLTVYRDTPQTQVVDLIHAGAFDPEVLERDGFDRTVMMIQEMQEGLDRAVKVPISSDQDPDDLIDDLFEAADRSEQAAVEAALSAAQAKESENRAARDAALAAEARDQSCRCAERSEQARDVAIEQVEIANGCIADGMSQIGAIIQAGKEAVTAFVEKSVIEINTVISGGINTINTILATELAKINVIISTNKEDQQAAISKAREWAEKDPDIPVEVDRDGERFFSAKHWAQMAKENLLTDVLPTGLISMWSGPITKIPYGWALCDGENGTPDLRDRFLVGAGGSYAIGSTGGADTAIATGSISNTTAAGTVGYHTLTTDEMPYHVHTVAVLAGSGAGTLWSAPTTQQDTGLAVSSGTGSSWGHSHDFAGTAHGHTFTGNAVTITPPYYALAFIIKI